MKLIRVKLTNKEEVESFWNLKLPYYWNFGQKIFVRCNKKGVINWDKAPVYCQNELDLRGNYEIINN